VPGVAEESADCFVARVMQVLDHALSGPEGSGNCERFVDALGLKTLFAAFVSRAVRILTA
jgi:hypothetical protein